jgi:hypothetical protein
LGKLGLKVGEPLGQLQVHKVLLLVLLLLELGGQLDREVLQQVRTKYVVGPDIWCEMRKYQSP